VPQNSFCHLRDFLQSIWANPVQDGTVAMRRSDIHAVLTSRGWLAEIDPLLATAVIQAGRTLELRKGDLLYNPEDNPGGMYGVVAGGMLMATHGRDGLPMPGHIARCCHWFGYGSVLEKQRRTMTMSANEPTVLLHIPLAELERLRTEHPGANRAYGKLATMGEALYLATVADLLIRDTDRRLAGVLLRVSGAEPPPYHPGYRPDAEALIRWSDPAGVPLTQTLLGELANASPHTVARFVERTSAADLIDWRYGRVRILDVLSLAAFAAGGSLQVRSGVGDI
jgi:CRP-like cAMP-binding protein